MKFCELAGYIFDLDGTLLASTSLWHGVYARALAHFGIEMPDDYVEHVNHLNIEKGTEYTARRFGLACGGEGVAKIWRKYAEEAYAHEVDLTPYARELLAALRGRGKNSPSRPLSTRTSPAYVFPVTACGRCSPLSSPSGTWARTRALPTFFSRRRRHSV